MQCIVGFSHVNKILELQPRWSNLTNSALCSGFKVVPLEESVQVNVKLYKLFPYQTDFQQEPVVNLELVKVVKGLSY